MLFLSAGLFSQDFGLETELFSVPTLGQGRAFTTSSEPGFVFFADDSNVNGEAGSGQPLWLHDLRRAEIVAFGSLPLTIFFSSFFVDLSRSAAHDWDSRYAPWPFKGAGAVDMDDKEMAMMFTAAVSGSLAIALVDHIIVRVKRARSRKTTPRLIRTDPQAREN
jgi:hypothetical protein